MAYFLQQLVNGISLGSVYGLIAIGYTMVYGIVGMINFAHGEIFMIGAFTSLVFLLAFAWAGVAAGPWVIVAVLALAMLFTGVYGWVVERVAYRPLRASFRLAPLISAIGMSIFLQNAVAIAQGARSKAIQPIIKGSFTLMVGEDDFNVVISLLQVVIIALTVVLMGALTWLVSSTSLGRQQRGCRQDRLMSAMLGVNVDRAISASFVIGSALAAVAGMAVLLQYGVIDFYVGFLFGVKAFTAAVLGGIGSLPGAMLGGLLIGLLEAFWSGYFPLGYKDAATFGVLMLTLIFLPNGLLGKPVVEKV